MFYPSNYKFFILLHFAHKFSLSPHPTPISLYPEAYLSLDVGVSRRTNSRQNVYFCQHTFILLPEYIRRARQNNGKREVMDDSLCLQRQLLAFNPQSGWLFT